MADGIEQPQLFDEDFSPNHAEPGSDPTPLTDEGVVVSTDRLVSERAAYERLSISRSTLRTITDLRPVHIGRSVRYRLSEVEAYIRRLT